MKHLDPHDLPSCPLSTHCLRMVDEIDQPNISQQLDVFAFTDDIRDERLLEKLRTHVPDCPTCTAALTRARYMRSQQRALLRDLLAEGERVVPSVAEQILAAIRSEQKDGQQVSAEETNNHHRRLDTLPILGRLNTGRQRTVEQRSGTHSMLLNALAVAVVALLILASVALFAHPLLTKLANNSTPTVPPQPPDSKSWNSVVIALVHPSGVPGDPGQISIANYDPITGRNMSLVPSHYPADTQIDGVSHDGHDLLYHYYDGSKTYYYLLPRSTDGLLYTVAGQSGNAIWTTDDSAVLINAPNGVVQVDTSTGTPRALVPSLTALSLTFYRNGFLYYIDSGDTMLHRVNLATGARQQVARRVTSGSILTNYLLKPDGSMIYFIDQGGNAHRQNYSIYAVNSDGTNFHPLQREGIPIGFAADNSLMFLRAVSDKYQVVKLGATPQQDRVVLNDAAPDITSLSSQDVALAPYGHAMVIQDGNYANSNRAIWYDDLTTGKQQKLFTLNSDTQAQLVGWDRIPVPAGTSITPTPTVVSSAPATPAGTDWNAVAIAIPNGTGPGLWNIANANYLDGQSNLLTPYKLSNPHFEGVSHDGKNVLYSISSSGHTMYFTTLSPLPDTGFFYELNDNNAGNAIWMSDSRHVLILAQHVGIEEVDTQTGQANTVLPLPLGKPGHKMEIGSLTFYRDGFLYFIGGDGLAEGALHRVQLNTDAIDVQQVTFRSVGATYWLSPDGSTVYFANRVGPAGQPGIYAVNSDGTNSRLLRSYTDGVPIGYAADNSLMIMRYVGGKFEVVKLGATTQQDQVVMADVAPGATSLCDTTSNAGGVDLLCDKDIALAPYGHALLVQATYADGSHKLWSDDLATGKQVELHLTDGRKLVQLIGWDRLSTP